MINCRFQPHPGPCSTDHAFLCPCGSIAGYGIAGAWYCTVCRQLQPSNTGSETQEDRERAVAALLSVGEPVYVQPVPIVNRDATPSPVPVGVAAHPSCALNRSQLAS